MQLSLHQTMLAIAVLISLTVLTSIGQVPPETVTAVFTLTLGGALGYINGKKAGGS